MDREERKLVFNHTVDTCLNKKGYTNSHGDFISVEPKDNFNHDRILVRDCYEEINFDGLKTYDTEIKVVNQDCLYAAKDLIDEGLMPAVVNNASFKSPGGGVENGSAAQEENLCRRSNLFMSIFKYLAYKANKYGLTPSKGEHYPLAIRFGSIYSPSVTVFKASEDKNYDLLDEPFDVDIITIAALKNPELVDGKINKADRELICDKIRTMLNLALLNGRDSIVLGAFGCGAYHNPAKDIAELFKKVLTEPDYSNKFKKIVFAIIDDKNAYHSSNPNGNFKPFEKEFK